MSYDGWLHEKDARQGRKIFLFLAVILLPVSLLWIHAWEVSLGLIVGSWFGWLVTPDADNLSTTREEYRAMRKFGPLGVLLVMALTPYAYLFSHRSIRSHSIIGTAIRAGTVFLVARGLVFLVKSIFGLEFTIPVSAGYASFFLAWSVQDMFHYKRDGLGWLGLKRRSKKERQGWSLY